MNNGIGLIDSAILIYTRESGSKLWTVDKKILGLLKDEECYRRGCKINSVQQY